MLPEIHRWFAYARWANGRMLDACDTIDPDALARDMGVSFGSVIGTVEHIHGADWIWLERWLGRSPSGFPLKGTIDTVDAARTAYDSLYEQRLAFLDTLDEAALVAPLRYNNMKGDPMVFPLGQILFHVSNHATYHRGQVIQLVKQLGGKVTSTDYFFWLQEP